MTPAQRAAALRLAYYLSADEWPGGLDAMKLDEAAAFLRELAAEPQVNPAPGYCKHCKQYTIEEPLPAEPQGEPVAEVIASDCIDGFTFRDVDGRMKWLRVGDMLYAHPTPRPLTDEPVAYIHTWKPHAGVIGKTLHWQATSPHGDDVAITPLYKRDKHGITGDAA